VGWILHNTSFLLEHSSGCQETNIPTGRRQEVSVIGNSYYTTQAIPTLLTYNDNSLMLRL
jgi:hypothetical protein